MYCYLILYNITYNKQGADCAGNATGTALFILLILRMAGGLGGGSGLLAQRVCERGSGQGAGKKPQAESLVSETRDDGRAGLGMRFDTISNLRLRFEIKTRPLSSYT